MVLVIDTADRFKIKIGLTDKGCNLQEFETDNQSADLLPKIEEVFKSKSLSLEDLSKILVNRGPGSYTGVRVGVTVANALAWSLNIPVIGFSELNPELIMEPVDQKFSQIVLPHYLN